MADKKPSKKFDDPTAKALDAFRDAWFSGKWPDVETFCREHAECGPGLRQKIEDFIYVAENLPDPKDGSKAGRGISGTEWGIYSGKILGDFKILRTIGTGGMGMVFEAQQISLNRRVALKVLPSHLSFSDMAVNKFRREAEAGGRQSHPGIVSVYAVGEHKGAHFIAQELVEGGLTLSDKLEDIAENDDFPKGYFRDVAGLINDVADALHHAHESGVIHRDVKPGNILLTKKGRPMVTDFGLARIEDALNLSRTGDFAGTPYYMSPEQAMSRRMGIDKRTDIYSLGVTLYEMLTLTLPFGGDTSHEVLKKIMLMDPVDPSKRDPRVPQDLSVICLKAMEKDPNHRYQSMKDLKDDLERFLSGDVIHAKAAGKVTRTWKRLKRNPMLSAAAGLGLLATLALVIVPPWFTWRVMQEKSESQDAYEELTRLSDMARLSALADEAETLWPAYPEKIGALNDWLGRAETLLERMELHRQTLKTLRAKALPPIDGDPQKEPVFEDAATRWQYSSFLDLVRGLEEFSNIETGLVKNVKDRLAFASTIEKRSILDQRKAWDRAIESIANPNECPLYKGLKIRPQMGMVPIGRDADSGLWEFVHLPLKDLRAPREEGGAPPLGEKGLVLVLLPGGDVRDETVAPFFLSKDEMTQAVRSLHPFEEALIRLGLRFPTEVERAYAARFDFLRLSESEKQDRDIGLRAARSLAVLDH